MHRRMTSGKGRGEALRWARRARPSPAMVVALVALFAALAGTGYAASKIGKKDIARNAVRSKHIKRQQIKSAEVKNRKLRGRDIRRGTLDASLFDESALGELRGPAGPRGPRGPVGPQGPPVRPSCDAGQVAAVGACFDRNPRPEAGLLEAYDVCDDAGGFLPSVAWMVSAADELGLFGGGDALRWTDSVDTDLAQGILVSSDQSFSTADIGSDQRFHCAFSPLS